MTGSKTFLMFLFTLLSVCTVARAQEASEIRLDAKTPEVTERPLGRRWQGEWNFEIGGDSFAEGKDEGAAAFLVLRTKFEWSYMSWFKAKAKPRAYFYSSRLQQRFDNDDYQNRLSVAEAYLSVEPVDFVDLRAGAISQEFLESPMMISSTRAFPGFQLLLSQDIAQYKGALVGQYVVPTSYSLNTEREDKERLPIFTTESLHLSGKNFDFIEWKLSGGHFNWSNMPDKVAFESIQVGNSVIGDIAPGSRFRYPFDGYFGGTELIALGERSPLQVVGEFQRISNTKAARGYGDAQMWGVGPRVKWGDRVFDLRYRRFFIERDATVAVYNRTMLGNTNRIGDNIEFKLDFKPQKFAVLGEWVQAAPLRDSDIQKNVTAFYLGVETDYAPF